MFRSSISSRRRDAAANCCAWHVLWAWGVSLCLLLSLHSILPQGLLAQSGPDNASAWSALASESFLSGGLIFVTWGGAVRFDMWRRGRLGVVSHLASLALWTFILLSWGVFRQTGEFPSESTANFLWMSGKQVLQHALEQAPLITLLVGAAAFALGFGVPAVATWSARRIAPPPHISQALLVLCFVSSALAAAVSGFSLSGDQSLRETPQARTTRGELFQYHRRYHAGPAAALFYQLPSSTLRTPLDQVRTPLRIERPALKPINAWVDRAQPKSRPNIIVVLVESLRDDVVGHPKHIMPHLDSLSTGGRLMTNMYTMASHSDAADPCALSGQGPIRGPRGSGGYKKDPPYPRVLIYDLLKGFGYRTALISSQNETWGEMLNFLDTGGLDHIVHSETYQGPTYVPEGDRSFKKFLAGKKKAGKIDDRFTVAEAIRWIGSNNDQPFFIYMNLQNSHFPYRRPSDFPARFTRPGDSITTTISYLKDEDIEPARRLYWDSLSYVDAQLGSLFAHLEQSGQMDKTALFITGDTGQGFMEHGFFTHARDLYNEVMRVPLVMTGPGIPPGKDNRLAAHIDLPSTILGLLEVPEHPSFHGLDLLAPQPKAPRSVFLSVNSFTYQQSIVREGFKLIYDLRRGRALLFDLSQDPGETTDISALKPDLFRDLLGRVNTVRVETVSYYTDEARMKTEFPPRFSDPNISATQF